MSGIKLFLSAAYFEDLMVRMAHHSTAIEGNTLTQGETKSVLIDGFVPRALDLRELHEVLNYKAFTKSMVAALQEQRPVDSALVKDFHQSLCYEAIEGIPGRFKTQPNIVIGADFIPSPPYRVPMDILDWCQNLAAQLDFAKTNEEVLMAICRQHFAFEHIHPFSDGNGRVGRALMVYSCLQAGVIPAVIPVEQKQQYIDFLNREDLTGFVAFCMQLQQYERQRIEGLQDERDKLWEVEG